MKKLTKGKAKTKVNKKPIRKVKRKASKKVKPKTNLKSKKKPKINVSKINKKKTIKKITNKKAKPKSNLKSKKKSNIKTKAKAVKKITGKIYKKIKKKPFKKTNKKAKPKSKKKSNTKTKAKAVKKITGKIYKKIKKKPLKKTNKKITKKNKKTKYFIIPSILITAFIFIFFQLTISFNKNLLKEISKGDHNIDENQSEQTFATETIDENESYIEETQNENENIVNEEESFEEKQNNDSNITENSEVLTEKSDDEIVKMIVKENSFDNTNISEELTNSADTFLENNPIEKDPNKDQLENIISENEIQLSGKQPVSEISENEIKRDVIEIESFVEKSEDIISEKAPEKLVTNESRNLQVGYCSKCQVQESPECNPCKDESFSLSYIQGEQICKNDLPIGYNAPGSIAICGGIKSFIVGEFIYWDQVSDQLDIGTINITNTTPQEFEILKFKSDSQMGFKVGVGTYFKRDYWDLFAQYTRLHKTENTIFDPSSKTGTFNTSWFYTNTNQFTLSTITTDIKSTWKIDLDKIDLELGRSYYLGNSLILRPFASLSGHSIDQKYDLSLTTTQLYSSSTKNDSWSIGPRFGLSTNWFLYKGFNLFGYIAFSLLYAENKISGLGDENQVGYVLKKINRHILRDVEEFKLGFAWGSYFTHNKWHFNLSLAYEAQRYSHTNYMSSSSQINLEANEIKPGDLFLQGLSAAARFDF